VCLICTSIIKGTQGDLRELYAHPLSRVHSTLPICFTRYLLVHMFHSVPACLSVSLGTCLFARTFVASKSFIVSHKTHKGKGGTHPLNVAFILFVGTNAQFNTPQVMNRAARIGSVAMSGQVSDAQLFAFHNFFPNMKVWYMPARQWK